MLSYDVVLLWHIVAVFGVEIKDNGVCVGQAFPEIENQKRRLFLFNGVSVAAAQSNQR